MYNILDFGQRIYLSIYSSFSINNTSNKFPWDDYKTPRIDDEAIQAIRDVADKYDIPVELITKLIVSVDTNKHITKNNKMQKAFDSIIGQGWLHYNSVEGALNHED